MDNFADACFPPDLVNLMQRALEGACYPAASGQFQSYPIDRGIADFAAEITLVMTECGLRDAG